MLNFCNTVIHTYILLHLFSLSVLWLRVSHHFKKRDQNILWFVIAALISLLVFPKTVRLNIILFMFYQSFLCHFLYCKIIYNLLFRPLNIDKVSKKYTRDTSSSFSEQVTSLSNQCKFSLANSLAGRFISRY